MKSLSRVQLFATPWTVAYQAPLSMEFSMQEYWSGLPFPSPNPKINTWINKSRIFTWSGACLPLQWDKIWSQNISQILVKFLIKRGGSEKWNVFCHYKPSAIAVLQCKLVKPEETQEGEKYLPASSHQTAATMYSELWGNSGYENTGP